MLIASGWSSMPSSRASATAAATALLEVFAVVATPTFYLVGSALASHGAMAVRSRLGGGADGQSRSSQREGALGLNAQNPSSPRPRMAPGFTSAGSCPWQQPVSAHKTFMSTTRATRVVADHHGTPVPRLYDKPRWLKLRTLQVAPQQHPK